MIHIKEKDLIYQLISIDIFVASNWTLNLIC